MGSRFLSAIASEMQALGVAWQIYNLTHRPLDLGLVGLAQFLPGVLLFLVAGHAADRISRRRILTVCMIGFASCSVLLLAFSLYGIRSIYPIYAVLVLNGVVRAFNSPAGHALLPQLVPEEHFPNAVTWGSSVFQGAMVIGPMIGGLIYGLSGSPAPVYAGSALMCVAALVLLLMIRIEIAPRPRGTASVGVVLDGLRYIWHHKLVLGAISLDLFAVLLGGAVALLPVFARDILRVGASGLGILRSAPSVGAVIMAVVIAHYPLRRRAGLSMLACVAGFGLFTIIFGLSRNTPLALAALLLVGACDMVSVVVRHTMVQLGTPDEMRGRVSAVNGVFIGASNEVGQFESGVTAQWFGTVPAVIIGGLGAIVVVALWAWWFPQLRQVDALSEAKSTKDFQRSRAGAK
jgi:MFS family permease